MSDFQAGCWVKRDSQPSTSPPSERNFPMRSPFLHPHISRCWVSYLNLTYNRLETYEYIVNGKSALEWVMEMYKFTKDKESGITIDPNDWSDDPRYIVNLVKRIVRVSIESAKIVQNLPALNEKEVY